MRVTDQSKPEVTPETQPETKLVVLGPEEMAALLADDAPTGK